MPIGKPSLSTSECVHVCVRVWVFVYIVLKQRGIVYMLVRVENAALNPPVYKSVCGG
jgi:hypothetical protein